MLAIGCVVHNRTGYSKGFLSKQCNGTAYMVSWKDGWGSIPYKERLDIFLCGISVAKRLSGKTGMTLRGYGTEERYCWDAESFFGAYAHVQLEAAINEQNVGNKLKFLRDAQANLIEADKYRENKSLTWISDSYICRSINELLQQYDPILLEEARKRDSEQQRIKLMVEEQVKHELEARNQLVQENEDNAIRQKRDDATRLQEQATREQSIEQKVRLLEQAQVAINIARGLPGNGRHGDLTGIQNQINNALTIARQLQQEDNAINILRNAVNNFVGQAENAADTQAKINKLRDALSRAEQALQSSGYDRHRDLTGLRDNIREKLQTAETRLAQENEDASIIRKRDESAGLRADATRQQDINQKVRLLQQAQTAIAAARSLRGNERHPDLVAMQTQIGTDFENARGIQQQDATIARLRDATNGYMRQADTAGVDTQTKVNHLRDALSRVNEALGSQGHERHNDLPGLRSNIQPQLLAAETRLAEETAARELAQLQQTEDTVIGQLRTRANNDFTQAQNAADVQSAIRLFENALLSVRQALQSPGHERHGDLAGLCNNILEQLEDARQRFADEKIERLISEARNIMQTADGVEPLNRALAKLSIAQESEGHERHTQPIHEVRQVIEQQLQDLQAAPVLTKIREATQILDSIDAASFDLLKLQHYESAKNLLAQAEALDEALQNRHHDQLSRQFSIVNLKIGEIHQRLRLLGTPAPMNTVGGGRIEFNERKGIDGAYGKTYKATYILGGNQPKEVAVKLFDAVGLNETEISGFNAEVNLIQRLRHNNIVSYEDHVVNRPNYALVMELMSDGSLFDAFKADVQFTSQHKLDIAKDAVAGLVYLHGHTDDRGGSKPIIHRDLKSPNLLLRISGDRCIAKWADFGLSVIHNNVDSQHGSMSYGSGMRNNREAGEGGAPVGTLRWMAPEILNYEDSEQHVVDRYNVKTDMWALGMTLWEIYSRQIPFRDSHSRDGRALEQHIIKHGADKLDRSCLKEPSAGSVARLVGQCWVSRNPEERPTAQQAMDMLNEPVLQTPAIPSILSS